MDDSSDEECHTLKRVNSITEWDEVPADLDFIFKVKLEKYGGKKCKFIYTLKRATSLPYSPILEGLEFTFNKQMEPSINGKRAIKENGCWKFEGI